MRSPLEPSSRLCPGRLRLSGSELAEKQVGDEHLRLGNPNERGGQGHSNVAFARAQLAGAGDGG